MLFRKSLKEIYTTYFKEPEFNFGKTILNKIPIGKKIYINQIFKYFDEAINDKDSQLLQFCIRAIYRDGISSEYIPLIKKIILETWHNENEDLVDIIFDFKDESFIKKLLEIAKRPDLYRKFDDENEATLRKCIHALKNMNTEKSKMAILELKKTQNPNVLIALEMYK